MSGSAQPADCQPSISLVLPIYNDEATIEPLTHKALGVLEQIASRYEVLLIDDGSPDASAALADELARRHSQVRVVHHARNLGYGAALRSGFQIAAANEWIAFLDGDDQYDPRELIAIAPSLPECDLVLTYRRHKTYGWARILLSAVYNRLVRLLFRVPFRDVGSGLKLVRAAMLEKLPLRSDSAFLGGEIAARVAHAGGRVIERPIAMFPRVQGSSAVVNVRSILATTFELLLVWLELSRQGHSRAALLSPADPIASKEISDRASWTIKELSGWGGFPRVRAAVVRPHRAFDRLDFIGGTRPVIPRGLGRSYGDASLPTDEGIALDATALDGRLKLDAKLGRLTAEGGVSLERILAAIVPAGWFLPVTPGTMQVTLAGALAANVHGKNHHRRGSISGYVRQLRALTEQGLRESDPDADSDFFRATLGGYGMTGWIQSATLDLLPIETSWMQVRRQPAKDLDILLALLTEADETAEYSIAWVDTTAPAGALGRGILATGSHAGRDALPRRLAHRALSASGIRGWRLPDVHRALVAPTIFRGLNSLTYRLARASEGLQSIEQFFYPLDRVRNWNLLYGPRGFVQYQFVVPDAAGIARALEWLRQRQLAAFVAGLKRTAFDDVLLPFAVPGYTLAFDLSLRDPAVLTALEELDQIVIENGGRVYLAKDARLGPANFRRMYPEYQAWRSVFRRFAPEGRFRSRLSQRLGWDAAD